jgi:HK97 family phage portal protein
MGLWQRFRNMLVQREQPTWRTRWLAPDQPAGIPITSETALEISVVWACVMAITTALASSRWNIFAVSGDARTRLPDDRLDYILNVRPNPEMPAVNMREALLVHALTWGNAYAEITRNARGDVAELWPLFPDRMIPRRRNAAPYALYYEYLNQDGGRTELEPENVFHLRGPGISGLMGDNVVSRAAKTMSLAAAQERFASTYFGNNTVIGGALKYPKTLTPEAHERVKRDWEDRYKGPFKANKPIILEGGMDWLPFKNDAETAQLVASRVFQVEEICRWYGVPPHKVQHLMRATFNNIEHLGIEFVRDALTPWARRHEQEADFKLLPQRAPWRTTKVDLGWLTHGDAKSRFEAYQIARNMGVYTANEIREKEGENTIGPEGDIRIVPMNMTTLERMAAGPAAPSASQPDSGGDPADNSGADGAALGNSLARDAVVILFASVFDRYTKRLRAREDDLRRVKKSAQEIDMHLAAEREKQRSWLVEECVGAISLLERLHCARPREEDILAGAEATWRGEDPKMVATRLLPAPEHAKEFVVRGA